MGIKYSGKCSLCNRTYGGADYENPEICQSCRASFEADNYVTAAHINTTSLSGLSLDAAQLEASRHFKDRHTLQFHDWSKGLPVWLEVVGWAALAGGVLWAIL